MDPRLPPFCYTEHPEDSRTVMLVRGEMGYFDFEVPPIHPADVYNEALGVSKAARQCMECGSMFGWEVPGAQLPEEDA